MSESPLNHPVLVEKIISTFDRVASIDEKIDQLRKQLPGIESKVEDHGKRISTLEQKVLKEDVAALRKDVDTMKSKWRVVAWAGSAVAAAGAALMSLDMAVIIRVARAAVGL